MMENKFEKSFQGLLRELVELAFEYVNNNVKEVDSVYVIGLIEKGYFYKSFYKINGSLVKSHKVNTVSNMQYDITNSVAFNLLRMGNETLAKIEELSNLNHREVPKELKLIYYPKTDKFKSEFGYEYTFSNSKTKTAQDVYEKWYEEIEKLNETKRNQ